MNKKYLVKFNCIIGEYEHLASCIFDKRKTEWGYCKEFWGISKKDQLKENCFWDDWMLNAIEVYSEKEITNDEAQIQMGVTGVGVSINKNQLNNYLLKIN
jgi:hypothetical protein